MDLKSSTHMILYSNPSYILSKLNYKITYLRLLINLTFELDLSSSFSSFQPGTPDLDFPGLRPGRPIRFFVLSKKHTNNNVRNGIIKCLPLLYNRSLAVTDTAPRFWCRRGYSLSFAVIMAETGHPALFHIMTSSLTMKNLRLVAVVQKSSKK